MRRLLLIFLLVMLPFQGAWAVVAGIAALDAPCAMSQSASRQAAQHAAHGDAGDASAGMAHAMADCDDGVAAEPCCDSGCSTCHGHGLVALVAVPVAIGSAATAGVVQARPRCGVPDYVPEQPLRPPLTPPLPRPT